MTQTLSAFRKLTVTELKLFAREPAAVFFTLAFPLLLLWLNSRNGNTPTPRLGGVGAIDALVPGYMAMTLATVGLTVLPTVLATYRERGILRRMAMTPISPAIVLGAHLLVQLLAATVGVAVLIGVAAAGFGLHLPAAPGGVAAAYVLGGVAIFAVGFLLASLLPTARAANTVGFVVYFPMIFLSGAAIPREMIPGGMRRIAEVLPLTHVVDGLRDSWSGAGTPVLALAVLGAIIGIAASLAARVFRWE
jgi:ABC-2 type transport system permease protein